MRNHKKFLQFAITVLGGLAFALALCSQAEAQVTLKQLLPGNNRLLSSIPASVPATTFWSLQVPAGATGVVFDVENLNGASLNYNISFNQQSVENATINIQPLITCYKNPQAHSQVVGNSAINSPSTSYAIFAGGTQSTLFVCPIPGTLRLGVTLTVQAGGTGFISFYANVLTGPQLMQELPYLDAQGGVGLGGNQFIHISTTTSTAPCSIHCYLHTITVNNPGSAWTFQVFDNGTCSGPVIATSSALTGQTTFVYDAQTLNGLCILTAGTTAGDLTVSYRAN